MPNWCENSVQFAHENKEMMEKLLVEVEKENLLNFIKPLPEELKDTTTTLSENSETNPDPEKQALIQKYGSSNWYSWCLSNWGTKWDITSVVTQECFDEKLFQGTNGKWTLQCVFDTAWGPPVEIFREMVERADDRDWR